MPVMEAKRKSKVKAAEWIDWYPGPPISPLPDDTVVDVELRNGMILKDVSAGAISWGSTGKYDGDVVRYRIVETSSRDPNWMPHDCRNHPRPPDYAMVRGKYRCGMLSDPYAAAKFGLRDNILRHSGSGHRDSVVPDGEESVPAAGSSGQNSPQVGGHGQRLSWISRHCR
jgi:hypothetical protein